VLQGSEMWLFNDENELALHRAQVKAIRLMYGVKLSNKLSYVEVIGWQAAVRNTRRSKNDTKK